MLLIAGSTYSQLGRSEVTYYSSDSLLITADLYMKSDSLPFLLLLHEQGSSRGEFLDIVSWFQKMNYNCLVPDLRNGGNSNVIVNETANRARMEERTISYNMIENDIQASIEYALEISGKSVTLLGAGANGSLALKAAAEIPEVKAVVALSPGEFFLPEMEIENSLDSLKKPILVGSTRSEYPYMEQLVSGVDDKYKSVFAPDTTEGARGTKSLLPVNITSMEYWLSILLFVKEIQ
ncbi:MAG: dienelactone hydrolase family protein [Bacteroidales bacterium]|nr:dienelactone hydrolase family protein [Bacteroidales bacterium]